MINQGPGDQNGPRGQLTRLGRVAIFGGRGGAAVLASYVSRMHPADGEVVGLLNDELPDGSRIHGFPVLGNFAAWKDLPADIRFLAPLHKSKEMQERAKLIQRLGVPESRWATVVDSFAAVAPDATMRHGCHVGPFVEIAPGVQLGRHVAVRSGAKVSHNVVIADFAFIGLNAVLCGYSKVGEGAHIAPNASVRENLCIGRFAVVGLGAVVIEDVTDFAIVAGSPAQRIGTVVQANDKEA